MPPALSWSSSVRSRGAAADTTLVPPASSSPCSHPCVPRLVALFFTASESGPRLPRRSAVGSAQRRGARAEVCRCCRSAAGAATHVGVGPAETPRNGGGGDEKSGEWLDECRVWPPCGCSAPQQAVLDGLGGRGGRGGERGGRRGGSGWASRRRAAGSWAPRHATERTIGAGVCATPRGCARTPSAPATEPWAAAPRVRSALLPCRPSQPVPAGADPLPRHRGALGSQNGRRRVLARAPRAVDCPSGWPVAATLLTLRHGAAWRCPPTE